MTSIIKIIRIVLEPRPLNREERDVQPRKRHLQTPSKTHFIGFYEATAAYVSCAWGRLLPLYHKTSAPKLLTYART